MEYLLSTENLTKQYGKKKAVDSVNIHVRQGDIYGLIGRNGAGKTTLINTFVGILCGCQGLRRQPPAASCSLVRKAPEPEGL